MKVIGQTTSGNWLVEFAPDEFLDRRTKLLEESGVKEVLAHTKHTRLYTLIIRAFYAQRIESVADLERVVEGSLFIPGMGPVWTARLAEALKAYADSRPSDDWVPW